MTDTRTETDSIGAIDVPAAAYWGAQTQRSIENFPFGLTERMPIGIVHAQAIVKAAAARVNRKHGLAGEIVDAIEAAAIHTLEHGPTTPDLGGTASTNDVGVAVAARLKIHEVLR